MQMRVHSLAHCDSNYLVHQISSLINPTILHWYIQLEKDMIDTNDDMVHLYDRSRISVIKDNVR
jgi:hypothetical protein